MTLLALVRHGRTDWNLDRRLQGRADIPLSASARSELAASRLPPEIGALRAVSSPLKRAVETAALLGLAADTDARLIEMDWGEFEGQRLDELRERHGADLAANEARGLDFTPPRGESPRHVQRRVIPFLAEVAAAGRGTVAVTHRGVIRVVYALASGWDMLGDPPHRLDLYAIQLFALARDGSPRIERLNLSLAPRR